MTTPRFRCPRGHLSDQLDYCSACGVPIEAGGTCPICGTVRADDGARFCEECGYDFVQHAPPSSSARQDPGRPPAPVSRSAEPPDASEWEVTIVVDTSLDVGTGPETRAPTGQVERLFPIDLREMLIGRRDDTQEIRPEIPIYDPGVSRRHARIRKLPEGGLEIIDQGSVNGTLVNGVELVPGEPRELHDGDRVTIGRWTRIQVRRRGRPWR